MDILKLKSKSCAISFIYLLVIKFFLVTKLLLLQTDMMTRAELAFSALDKNKKGYITAKELMKLTKKLSKEELMNLMAKVTLRKHNTSDRLI